MHKILLSLVAVAAGAMSALAQPTITQPPTNQVLAMGATLTLNVTASDTAPLAYQWFKDQRLLFGATNTALTVPNAGVINSGSYYVVVTDGSGMVISRPALVAVGNPSLLTWGADAFGELGNGATANSNLPLTVASNVVAGAAGDNFSLFVTTDGTLWAMGENNYGQFGNGTKSSLPRTLPSRVANNVVAAAAGASHSLFVKSDGTLCAMGYDADGELGNGTTGQLGSNYYTTPLVVASNVVAVAAGADHSLFLKMDGTLWTMGSGVTIPVVIASNVVAAAAGVDYSLFTGTDGTLWEMNSGLPGNANLPVVVASNVIAVASGAYHFLFVTMDGTLWGTGNDTHGQLGDGTSGGFYTEPVTVASNVVAVAAGQYHSLFVTNGGMLWTMGWNLQGQLGDGTNSDADWPVNVSHLAAANVFPADQADHSLAIGVLQAPALVVLNNLDQPFTGSAINVTASTTPPGLTVNLTYNGSQVPPTNAGSYTVIGTISDPHYYGGVTKTLIIASNVLVTLGDLNQIYTGSAVSVTADTIPPGVAVLLTYNGSPGTPTNAGSYTVIATISDPNYFGSATNTLVINPAPAIVTLTDLNQTYTAGAINATVSTIPTGLMVDLSYSGSPAAPTNVGSYTVIGIVSDPNGYGSATNTLVINPAPAMVTLANLNQAYTGGAINVTVSTIPVGLTVNLTYNGSPVAPTNPGSYTVIGTISDPNYLGSTTNTLVINPAPAIVMLANLDQPFTGSGINVTATTTPPGLTVNLTYNGSPAAPTNAGSYTVIGTISDPRYYGGVTNTLIIASNVLVTLSDLNQIYTGSAISVTADTIPPGVAMDLTYNGSPAAPTNAGSYTVIGTISDPNYFGSATNTLVINPATAMVTMMNLNQAYTGGAINVTVSTIPIALTLNLTYNSSPLAPTNAGSYTVIATISDPNYFGGATNTLVINPAPAIVTLANLNQASTGGAINVTVSTIPIGLTVNLTYNGSPVTPTNPGSYAVIGTISDPNYLGSTTNTLVIFPPPTIIVAPTNQTLAVGDTLTMNVTADGTTPLGYQWFKDSRLLLGATNSGLTVANARVANSGSYYVVVTNEGGMVISLPALVTVGNPSLIAWGANSYGQLGDGTTNNALLPLTVASNAVAGSAGGGHSLFVTTDGTLWAMGLNGHGQLGNNTTNNASQPLSMASNVVAVAAGNAHSLFVTADGTLWAMGGNSNGQLGTGLTSDAMLPTSVASNVVAVAAGSQHSLFVKMDGTLWAMGCNLYGELGNGDSTGSNVLSPECIARNVVAVTAGYHDSLFVTMGGTLWAMGWNSYGQLGDNINTNNFNPNPTPASVASNVVAVAAGQSHSLFVTTDGSLWAMGENYYGELGNGTTSGYSANPTPFIVASNVMTLASGSYHSLFVKNDGTMSAMGWNNYGQLGDGNSNNTSAPVNVPHLLSVANILQGDCSPHSLALGINTNATVTLGNLSQAYTGGAINVTASTLPPGLMVNVAYNGSPVAPTNVGSYTVIAAISDPSYYSSIVTNTLVIAPNATVTLGNLKQFYTGGAISVTATTMPPGLAVNLTYNGSPFAPTNPGTYTVVGTITSPNYAGYATNTLVIVPLPPTITAGPTNQTVALGGTLTLGATVGGTSPVYQWFKDGRRLLGATNGALTVANAGMTNSGTYFLVVSNGAATVISLPALVAVGNPGLVDWGYNVNGQLGNGTTSTNYLPVTVASNVVAGAAGGYHSLFVTSDGTLWAMGNNYYGQLGNGSTSNTKLAVGVASNVVAVAAGAYHSLFVRNDGTLWAMGYNYDGQLGNGTTSNANLPVSVASNVVAVAAGAYHSLFVKNDGTLWAMGLNSYGQLGNSTTSTTNLPIPVASNVVAVAAGSLHSLFMKFDGTLWAMGYNYYGQLGNGTTSTTYLPIPVASNVVAVAAGADHSLFVKTNATLWAMGYNSYGQLGNGTTSDAHTPINVAANVVAVAAGYYHSLFVQTNATIWTMGYNKYGQLGNGTTNDSHTPISLPYWSAANAFQADQANHALMLGANFHAIVTLGNLNQNYVGNPISVTAATSPPGLTVNLTYNGSPVAPTNAGSYTVIGTISDPYYFGGATNTLVISWRPSIIAGPTNQVVTVGGTISLGVTVGSFQPPTFQWFKDSRRLLGATNSLLTMANADMTNSGIYYVLVTNLSGVAISLPATVAVGNPALLAWGNNQYGQLGNGTTNNACLPLTVASNVVTGTSGQYHSLFVTTNGILWAMGWNNCGQLGNGKTNDAHTPVSVASNVVAVAAGYTHSLFVKTDGTLWAMGWNAYGQLGNGTTNDADTPVSVASNVVAIAAGWMHSLFVTSDGTLWAMGSDGWGQLGNGTSSGNYTSPVRVTSNVVAVVAQSVDSLFVKTDGTLWVVGDNSYAELGNGTFNSSSAPFNVASNVVAVASGEHHTDFTRTDGSLWAVGLNRYGQLGNGINGTYSYATTPITVASNVLMVAAGEEHSQFVKTDGTFWTMGWNLYGQLGNGTTGNSNLPICILHLSLANILTSDQAYQSLALGINYNAVVTLGNLNQPYSGSAINVTATSAPPGLAVNLTYNGSPAAPTNAGNYTVIGAVCDANYCGGVTNTLIVGAPPQNFTGNSTGNTNGQQLTLQLTGTPGYPYILQWATNLTPPINWQVVFSNSADSNGNWSFAVTNLTLPRGFYRAVGQ